jgi:hypothetical protein
VIAREVKSSKVEPNPTLPFSDEGTVKVDVERTGSATGEATTQPLRLREGQWRDVLRTRRVFVNDRYNHRIQIFGPGNLYVAEMDAGRFQKFLPSAGANPAYLIGKPSYEAWK